MQGLYMLMVALLSMFTLKLFVVEWEETAIKNLTGK